MKNYIACTRLSTTAFVRRFGCVMAVAALLASTGCQTTSQESQQAQIALAAAQAEVQAQSRGGASASTAQRPGPATQASQAPKAVSPVQPAPSNPVTPSASTAPAETPATSNIPAVSTPPPAVAQPPTRPIVPAASASSAASTPVGAIAPEPSRVDTVLGGQASGEQFILREGDAVRITFPGAPNLNTVQAIRRDGVISLPLIGEVHATGLTPTQLQERLLELYAPQLQTKEVNVALESSAFAVYVIGAVLRPGKIVTDRPLSALEAVMEAGGFDFSRANMKNVRVIRYVNGKPQYFNVNLKKVMNGKGEEPFPIKPSDILYVPERFVWF